MMIIKIAVLKVNKSVYIPKSRQRHVITHNNFLLHVPNHALKDFLCLINHGTSSRSEILHNFAKNIKQLIF